MPVIPSATASWPNLLKFIQDSHFFNKRTNGYSAEKFFFILNIWQGDANSHETIHVGKTANVIAKNMIRFCGDIDGKLWPYLYGPISAPAAYAALSAIFDGLSAEHQEQIHTLHPVDKISEFNPSSGGEDPTIISLYAKIISWGPDLTAAVSSAFPPLGSVSHASPVSENTTLVSKAMESLAAAASNNVSGADDKDIAAASLKGNAFTSTKWRELCKLPAFNKLILKAVGIQTTAVTARHSIFCSKTGSLSPPYKYLSLPPPLLKTRRYNSLRKCGTRMRSSSSTRARSTTKDFSTAR